jgi:hypothetical protein
MPHEVEFDYFVGMTRNEIESDPNRQFMFGAYCRAWEQGDSAEAERLLPKLGMRRSESGVEWAIL